MCRMVTVGQWLKPWPGETLVGEVMAVSVELVLCRASGGLSFSVRLCDVVAGLVPVIRGQVTRRWASHPWIRLTAKAMVS